MYFKNINFILIILAVSGSFQAKVSAFQVLTQPNVTAVRGRSVTLPCTFPDGPPVGVYWDAHNYTDSSVKHARIVAQVVKGVVSTPGGSRYSITKEYSLVITNVTIHDETTFICTVVVPEAAGMNRTNVRVIALANPLHPVVNGCPISYSDSCTKSAPCCIYTVADIVPETFSLTCSVNLVRPAVSLTWTGGNGEERPTTDSQTLTTGPDANGLFNISAKLEVSKRENGQNFICKASGEGVDGKAHVTASVQYPPVEVSTEPSLTAVWGGTIRLPCRFEDHPTGVYWFRHSATGAPFVDSDENLLVHFFRSQANAEGDILVKGGPRFKMTSDYSLMISNVAVGDETTYSCQVAGAYSDGHNETDLRVIEKSGLSAGGLAGIIISFLLLLIGNVVALFWYREKAQLVKVNALIKEIKKYKPGDFLLPEAREGTQLPKEIRLALFGITAKSSLVRSFYNAVNGNFVKLRRLPIKTEYQITDYISVVNACALIYLDVTCIPDVMAQIRKNRELNILDCPALVFDAREAIYDLQKFLPAFITAVQKEYATDPPVIFTHKEEVKDQRENIESYVAELGVLKERLYFVENFPKKPTEPCIEMRLEFLKMLKTLLDFANENMGLR